MGTRVRSLWHEPLPTSHIAPPRRLSSPGFTGAVTPGSATFQTPQNCLRSDGCSTGAIAGSLNILKDLGSGHLAHLVDALLDPLHRQTARE